MCDVLNEAFDRAYDEVHFLGITVYRRDHIVIIDDSTLYRGNAIFEMPESRDVQALALFLSQQGDPILRTDAAIGLREITDLSVTPKCIEFAVGAIRKHFNTYGDTLFKQRIPGELLNTTPAWEFRGDDRAYNIQMPPGPGQRGYKRPVGLAYGR